MHETNFKAADKCVEDSIRQLFVKGVDMRIVIFLVMLILPVQALGQGKLVQYTVNGNPYEGYFVSSSKEAPFILLIHDWDGLTDYEIKRADMLAAEGYTVFAADLFGAGVRPTEVQEKRQVTGELYKDRQKMRARMNGAIAKAQALGAWVDNGVVMGYCFGGAAVLELARSGVDMKLFATFHGGLSTPEGQNYNDTKGEILVFHGTADSSVTMQDFANLAEELEAAGVSHEMTTYSGAPHAFTVFGSERYCEDADKKSWRRFLQALKDITGNLQ